MVISGQTSITSEQRADRLPMPSEPTTLATVARCIADTLQTRYGVDPVPVLAQVGLSPAQLEGAGARCASGKIQQLWAAAEQACGDPCFGLCVGQSVRPTTFHAVGYSVLASHTLLEGLQRVSRYYNVISTVPVEVAIALQGDSYVVSSWPTAEAIRPTAAGVDAFMVAILKLCRLASNPHLCPERVVLMRSDPGHLSEFTRVFDAPVAFGGQRNELHFDKALLDAPLPGENHDLAMANDEVAEHYLAALDPLRVSSEVRRLLVDLLPTGEARAATVAKRLNRSVSSLQRQLRREKTSYKDIAEGTRRALAEDYVREGQLSLSQIAYLLGFSDQSNFARAFRRWTGAAPRQYRARVRSSERETS